jgi:hypothetical protein
MRGNVFGLGTISSLEVVEKERGNVFGKELALVSE